MAIARFCQCLCRSPLVIGLSCSANVRLGRIQKRYDIARYVTKSYNVVQIGSNDALTVGLAAGHHRYV
jgi:hypothetical protein